MTAEKFLRTGLRTPSWRSSSILAPRVMKRKTSKAIGATTYRDTLVKLVVDVADSKGHPQWLKAFRDRWKAKLEQIELWMVSYRIEIE